MHELHMQAPVPLLNISATSLAGVPQNEQHCSPLSVPLRDLCVIYCLLVLLLSLAEHVVDKTILLSLGGRKPVVAVGVALDLLVRSARVCCEYLV